MLLCASPVKRDGNEQKETSFGCRCLFIEGLRIFEGTLSQTVEGKFIKPLKELITKTRSQRSLSHKCRKETHHNVLCSIKFYPSNICMHSLCFHSWSFLL